MGAPPLRGSTMAGVMTCWGTLANLNGRSRFGDYLAIAFVAAGFRLQAAGYKVRFRQLGVIRHAPLSQ